MKKIIHNGHRFKKVRRDLRQKSTPEETLLWSKLRNNQLGYKFKRQQSIDRFIVDFYCASKMLVIEIDGEQHLSNEEYDKERSLYLNELGIRVIRFWNGDLGDIDKVVDRIKLYLS